MLVTLPIDLLKNTITIILKCKLLIELVIIKYKLKTIYLVTFTYLHTHILNNRQNCTACTQL